MVHDMRICSRYATCMYKHIHTGSCVKTLSVSTCLRLYGLLHVFLSVSLVNVSPWSLFFWLLSISVCLSLSLSLSPLQILSLISISLYLCLSLSSLSIANTLHDLNFSLSLSLCLSAYRILLVMFSCSFFLSFIRLSQLVRAFVSLGWRE